ncbi:MAG: crotonase/enoyl-CoA hydratase family protein, partial [Desulfobacteraceae bacterium]|nr:crotonase/enoyl-CoA hydratase family protein [Desulfobacteraceae bacterium]
MSISVEKHEHIWTVIIDRTEKKNAVDRDTAERLYEAFTEFDQDEKAGVAVLWGRGGTFCAGADLGSVARLSEGRGNRLDPDMSAPGPMGPSRMVLGKPVIAAVSGYAVAGGLELACWCDIRVVEETAVFGVYCRRFGVPLIDGGTQRLPRIIGQGRALDMVLTGRSVDAQEALEMGLANYVVQQG